MNVFCYHILLPLYFICGFTEAIVISTDDAETLFKNYNPKILPTAALGKPVHNELQLYIVTIDSVRDSSMDYSMSFYFRQRWLDPRLAYNFSDVDVIELDSKQIDNIWVPDIYIINEKAAKFHDITVPNRLVNIYPDGRIFYSVRISGTFSCSMQLYKYPLDRQICDIRFESYSYSSRNIIVRWHDSAAKFSPTLTLPQFNLTKHKTFLCDGIYLGVNYTCVGLQFYLERNRGYYITQIYVPSILIIVLSWVNFWLSIDAVPARISLGLLTVLTMSTQSSTALSDLQKVSYIKALDVWLAVCLFFVFAALIEFAFVNVASRVEQRRKQSSNETATHQDGDNYNSKTPPEKKQKTLMKVRDKARRIDRMSRVLFPISFMLFNAIYWTVYLVWEPVPDE